MEGPAVDEAGKLFLVSHSAFRPLVLTPLSLPGTLVCSFGSELNCHLLRGPWRFSMFSVAHRLFSPGCEFCLLPLLTRSLAPACYIFVG